MDDLQKYFISGNENNYIVIFISLILCIISSFILKIVYINKSNSISSKVHIGSIIPILSLITFLIILVVKSSLALSLGLIGALSIVRFRTPIKEPEELIYLFLSIAIGIGYGSGQNLITIVVFSVIILIIWFFLSYRDAKKEKNYNLFIEYELKQEPLNKENILNEINRIFKDFEVKKIEINNNILEIMGSVSLSSTTQIDELDKYFTNKATISFSENNVYF
jgi:uncharacterized membrane protein YhiD involved in acid resistance